MTQCAEPESCPSPVETVHTRQHILRDSLGVLLGAIVLLLIAGQFADLRRWHVNGWWDVLNDQVGYISVARNLVEKGKLESNIIYTSTLKQKASRNYLYMPGHYFLLALSFKIGGIGPVQSVLPSLIAYCIACVCVGLAARKLYGRRAGFFAAALFALFPPMLAFAFTAMMELTLVAAAAAAFCIFVYLPEKVRPYVGPALLALPLFFRETTPLLAIPMAGLILGGIPLVQRIPRERWRTGVIFGILSIVVVGCIVSLPISSGRISLNKAVVFDRGNVDFYQDATAWDRLPRGPIGWVKGIGGNIVKNFQRLGDLRIQQPLLIEPLGLVLILAGMIFCLVDGLRRRDAAAFSFGFMTLMVFVLIFAVRRSSELMGLRFLLFAWPLLAMSIGAWISNLRLGPVSGATLRVASAGIGALALVFACRAIYQIAGNDWLDEARAHLVAAAHANDARVLCSTYDIGLNYIIRNSTGRWAFIPANARTLALLTRKYDVGTLIVTRRSTSLTGLQLKKAGFIFDTSIVWRGQRVLIYKSVPGPAHRIDPTSRPQKAEADARGLKRKPGAGAKRGE